MSSLSTEKSIKNALSGICGQLITIVFGFYIPRLVIIGLGSESNGLLSSIGNLIAYLSLLEAGIGLASLQALYSPLSRADTNAINGILAATKRFYQKTGLFYGLAVIGVAVLYPIFIHSEISLFNISTVILLSGLPNVINFYFQGKYILLLKADGKTYILTNIQTATYLIVSLGKVLLLNNGFGLISLQLLYCTVAILQMLFIEYYIHKHYCWLNLTVPANMESLQQRNSVLIHEISRLVFNSTDSFILSIICGLKTTSIYAVYNMLVSTIGNALNSVADSVTFIMGQTFHKDRTQFLEMYTAYEVYNTTLSFALFTIANIFLLPFIQLYTSGAEISYVDRWLPYLFIAPYLLKSGRMAPMNAIAYAGMFKQTRWHAVSEMVINLVISIIGAYYLGIYGVLFGTIAALLFRSNVMIYYGCKKVLHIQMWNTYWVFGTNLVLFVFATFSFKAIFQYIVLDSYVKIICWVIPTGIVCVLYFFVIESLLNKRAFQFVRPLLEKPILQFMKNR